MIVSMNTALLDRPSISDHELGDVSQPPDSSPPRRNRRGARLWHRDPGEARWVRPALVTLLAATAVLYIWGLGASGWANSFYSAAVQAGSQSWKAMFFGSSDASNFITVDKPPAALWIMALSVRIFGLNSWSILVPEALMGVASVGVLYATVKRWFGAGAGLIAGLVLAVTPVATLMFRFNNPDAMLVLVLVGAAYCMTRALETAAKSTKWLSIAFALVGLGFLTKMMQALLVLPAFGLVYLFAGPTRLRKRIAQLAIATAAFLVAAGWWVAVVELVPASWRPYVGGSTNNSILNLILGYNGFGRLTGSETGSSASQWGATGWLRMFNSEFGGQASWLLPAALLLLGAGLLLRGRAPRTDRHRSALLLWGGWLVVTGATFSLGQGIIHPYYTVALAPAIGALVGIGSVMLWRGRDKLVNRIGMAAVVAVTAWWACTLLGRTPTWNAWLVPVVIASAAIAVIGLVGPEALRRRGAKVVVAAALIASLAGPTAYSIATAAATHTGSIPSAGPSTGRGIGFGGGGAGRGNGPGAGGTRPTGNGTFPGGNGTLPTGATTGTATTGRTNTGGGAGGLLNASTPSAALTTLLETNSGDYTWVAAAVGANSAAGYQLATNDPVMAIGGFNGSDPWPTLAVFEQYVANGRIHYFIAGGGQGGGGQGGVNGSSTTNVSSEITSWVESHYTATTVGGVTVYDLTVVAS
ncbi:MAG: glycosyl transferase [Ilumatobacteraceae bacterium]|nr:glycosyl transferase [Ilumatobacteraceae bacterium]